MSATICGHDREALREALTRANGEYATDKFLRDLASAADEPIRSCFAAIIDPAKLAVIIAEMLRERGIVDGNKFANITTTPAQYITDLDDIVLVVLWREQGGSIGQRLELPRARRFALALLDAPADANIEQMIVEVAP